MQVTSKAGNPSPGPRSPPKSGLPGAADGWAGGTRRPSAEGSVPPTPLNGLRLGKLPRQAAPLRGLSTPPPPLAPPGVKAVASGSPPRDALPCLCLRPCRRQPRPRVGPGRPEDAREASLRSGAARRRGALGLALRGASAGWSERRSVPALAAPKGPLARPPPPPSLGEKRRSPPPAGRPRAAAAAPPARLPACPAAALASRSGSARLATRRPWLRSDYGGSGDATTRWRPFPSSFLPSWRARALLLHPLEPHPPPGRAGAQRRLRAVSRPTPLRRAGRLLPREASASRPSRPPPRAAPSAQLLGGRPEGGGAVLLPSGALPVEAALRPGVVPGPACPVLAEPREVLSVPEAQRTTQSPPRVASAARTWQARGRLSGCRRGSAEDGQRSPPGCWAKTLGGLALEALAAEPFGDTERASTVILY